MARALRLSQQNSEALPETDLVIGDMKQKRTPPPDARVLVCNTGGDSLGPQTPAQDHFNNAIHEVSAKHERAQARLGDNAIPGYTVK